MKLKHLYYGWIIVFISLCVLATNAIAVTGFGLFLKPLIAEFGWERMVNGGIKTEITEKNIIQ